MDRPGAPLLQSGDSGPQACYRRGETRDPHIEGVVSMARLPRGIKLTDPRREGNVVTYTLEVARWRKVLLVLSVLRRVRIRIETTVSL